MVGIRRPWALWLSVSAVVMGGPLLGACGDDDGQEGEPSTTVDANGDGPVQIDIVGIVDGFEPATASVTAGTEVVWTNTNGLSHTTTADEQWGSGTLGSCDTFSFTPTEPGKCAYCSIHPSMTGELVVEQ